MAEVTKDAVAATATSLANYKATFKMRRTKLEKLIICPPSGFDDFLYAGDPLIPS